MVNQLVVHVAAQVVVQVVAHVVDHWGLKPKRSLRLLRGRTLFYSVGKFLTRVISSPVSINVIKINIVIYYKNLSVPESFQTKLIIKIFFTNERKK